jgi:hypothetical protein
MTDWIESVKGQRANVVEALLHGTEHEITFETLALQSLLNIYYQRKFITQEVFDEHYDFTVKVLNNGGEIP